MAGYAIVRDTEAEAQAELERITTVSDAAGYGSYQDFVSKSQLDTEVNLRDYSVSNQGFGPSSSARPSRWPSGSTPTRRSASRSSCCSSRRTSPSSSFAEQVIPLVRELEAGALSHFAHARSRSRSSFL